MFGTLLAVALAVVAAWILFVRIRRFVRTRGQSGCDNCPYSGGCSKKK